MFEVAAYCLLPSDRLDTLQRRSWLQLDKSDI